MLNPAPQSPGLTCDPWVPHSFATWGTCSPNSSDVDVVLTSGFVLLGL